MTLADPLPPKSDSLLFPYPSMLAGSVMVCTGEKAIGTGWTVAPPEEEVSNWGGTT